MLTTFPTRWKMVCYFRLVANISLLVITSPIAGEIFVLNSKLTARRVGTGIQRTVESFANLSIYTDVECQVSDSVLGILIKSIVGKSARDAAHIAF